jgi:hypothetical protein
MTGMSFRRTVRLSSRTRRDIQRGSVTRPRVVDEEDGLLYLFEGALISASSLGLASFFGSIISHVRSYQIQQHHVRITETTSHQYCVPDVPLNFGLVCRKAGTLG